MQVLCAGYITLVSLHAFQFPVAAVYINMGSVQVRDAIVRVVSVRLLFLGNHYNQSINQPINQQESIQHVIKTRRNFDVNCYTCNISGDSGVSNKRLQYIQGHSQFSSNF